MKLCVFQILTGDLSLSLTMYVCVYACINVCMLGMYVSIERGRNISGRTNGGILILDLNSLTYVNSHYNFYALFIMHLLGARNCASHILFNLTMSL